MEIQALAALRVVAAKYNKKTAATVEQIYRNETGHFKSGNFIKTLSPGMEAFSETEPYGWSSLKDFWEKNKNYAPTGIFKQVENSSGMLESRGERKFIVFPTIEASMMSVAFVIMSRGGDGGAWFSISDQAQRDKYNNYLAQINPRLVNANIS